MQFQKNVKREVRDLLTEQLKEYESRMKMTRAERKELYKWVASGRSPYDNGNYLSDCTGIPLDFLRALRMEEDFLEWFEGLSKEEQAAQLSAASYYDETDDDIRFDVSGLSEENPF